MAKNDLSLYELNARLEFFPRLRAIFTNDWLTRGAKDPKEGHPLLGWLSGFSEDGYAREMVFGIERALDKLAHLPGYQKFSSGLKATKDLFWSTLGHLSLAAFFSDIDWEVELEPMTPGKNNGHYDLLVRRKQEGVGIEIKSVSDLASGWTERELEDHYRETPRFVEELRKYPELEPVPLRDSEAIARLVRSRALKARKQVQGMPCVLALDCSRSLEDSLLREALTSAADFGMDAVVTFSVGGSDLYPETRKVVKESPWLETPLGSAFRSAWEGADSRYALLRSEADRIADLLQREYDPEEILLFGSVVQGRVRETSDIDILIIKRTQRPYWERFSEVLSVTRPSVPLDVFVYTPEEFEDLKRQGDFFITREVLSCYERVYERPQAVA